MLMSRKRMPYIESLSSMSSRSSAAIVGDLRHAQAARVIGEHDVTAEPLGDLVERFAHDAKVLLRRVRAAEPFGRRAKRNEVEQRLPGRANDRDDLRARLGRGDRGRAIFVDIAARDDHVEQRRRQLRKLGETRVAFGAVRAHASKRRLDERAQRTARCFVGACGELRERQCAGGEGFARRPRIESRLGQTPFRSTMATPRERCSGESASTIMFGTRNLVRADAVDAEQPQHRALDRNRRMGGDEVAHRRGDRSGKVRGIAPTRARSIRSSTSLLRANQFARPNLTFDLASCFVLGNVEIITNLQSKPYIGRSAKIARETQGCISSNRAPAVDDTRNPIRPGTRRSRASRFAVKLIGS